MPTYNPTDSRYLVIAQTRTRNGQTDIKIVLDLISNEFYTLDDDGNFILIAAGVGSQTLEQVLLQGNYSPNLLNTLNVNDTEASLKYDNLNNIVIKAEVTDTEARLEHSASTAQIQSVSVNDSIVNMRYQDAINIVIVELGLGNGFIAVRTNDAGDYENSIQVEFDKVNLVFNDVTGGFNFEHKIDADGYSLKNLPAFQDDAAASGLTAGYLYQTTGTGAAPLDVAGIMMIKQ